MESIVVSATPSPLLRRAIDDPEPSSAALRRVAGMVRALPPREVVGLRILDHLRDGVPRTFARIIVELFDRDPFTLVGSYVEAAMWELTRMRFLTALCDEDGAVLFQAERRRAPVRDRAIPKRVEGVFCVGCGREMPEDEQRALIATLEAHAAAWGCKVEPEYTCNGCLPKRGRA